MICSYTLQLSPVMTKKLNLNSNTIQMTAQTTGKQLKMLNKNNNLNKVQY